MSKRRARLEGLDAPERQEIIGRGITRSCRRRHPSRTGDLDQFTAEQPRQLQELLRLASAPAARVGA